MPFSIDSLECFHTLNLLAVSLIIVVLQANVKPTGRHTCEYCVSIDNLGVGKIIARYFPHEAKSTPVAYSRNYRCFKNYATGSLLSVQIGSGDLFTLLYEAEYGAMAIFLVCFQNGRGKTGLVGRIGEELGFQTEALAWAVGTSPFSGSSIG